MHALFWRREWLAVELVFVTCFIPLMADAVLNGFTLLPIPTLVKGALKVVLRLTSFYHARKGAKSLYLLCLLGGALLWGIDKAGRSPQRPHGQALHWIAQVTGRRRSTSDEQKSGFGYVCHVTVAGLLLWTGASTVLTSSLWVWVLLRGKAFEWVLQMVFVPLAGMAAALIVRNIALWWRYGLTYGQIIAFPRGMYNHIGVGDGRGAVIHVWRPANGTASDFAAGPIDIRRDPLNDVAGPQAWEIAPFVASNDGQCTRRSSAESVARALEHVNHSWHYRLTSGNCEHFATYICFRHPNGHACGGYSLQSRHKKKVAAGFVTVVGGGIAVAITGDVSWVSRLSSVFQRVIEIIDTVPGAFMSWFTPRVPGQHQVDRYECTCPRH